MHILLNTLHCIIFFILFAIGQFVELLVLFLPLLLRLAQALLLIGVLDDLLAHVVDVVSRITLQLLLLMLFLHLPDPLLLLGCLGCVRHLLQLGLLLSLDVAAVWAAAVGDYVGLRFPHELSQISSFDLFVFEFLHNLIPYIIRFRRKHLRLVFLAVELAHGLRLIFGQLRHLPRPNLILLSLSESLDLRDVRGVADVVINIMSQSFLLRLGIDFADLAVGLLF